MTPKFSQLAQNISLSIKNFSGRCPEDNEPNYVTKISNIHFWFNEKN